MLGAGASIAALPKGDKNGLFLPNLKNVCDFLDLTNEIEAYGLSKYSQDFEALYSYIYDKSKFDLLKTKIEKGVRDYFEKIDLPEEVNLYDYLLFSLRKKDVIASFNWDPLLIKAYERNYNFKDYLPKIVFLHGNVWHNYCERDDVLFPKSAICPKCGAKSSELPILFPVEHKDYNSDFLIKESWNSLRALLKEHFLFTIFGYSGPKSDIEARNLLKDAWEQNTIKELADTEIIDIKNEKEIQENWDEFLFSHHYSIYQGIEEGYSFTFPRRSCEAHFALTQMLAHWPENRFPKFKKLAELHDWIQPLLEDEKRIKDNPEEDFEYKAIIYKK
ncbi:hypothetical protein [Leptospira neocaledonica]|uniref:Deacetylase sirtuin-type domain-containing protein n=1 Tax=Leptospira neocaledonica TaxID=2023192 RepID=A0A2M9ZX08_9LEPT|nr:hypothetical protein [Leptospira neocaledonica]PJZ76580.1 hypothetical protein CH365_14510 [Leptospira neocaledonica]